MKWKIEAPDVLFLVVEHYLGPLGQIRLLIS